MTNAIQPEATAAAAAAEGASARAAGTKLVKKDLKRGEAVKAAMISPSLTLLNSQITKNHLIHLGKTTDNIFAVLNRAIVAQNQTIDGGSYLSNTPWGCELNIILKYTFSSKPLELIRERILKSSSTLAAMQQEPSGTPETIAAVFHHIAVAAKAEVSFDMKHTEGYTHLYLFTERFDSLLDQLREETTSGKRAEDVGDDIEQTTGSTPPLHAWVMEKCGPDTQQNAKVENLLHRAFAMSYAEMEEGASGGESITEKVYDRYSRALAKMKRKGRTLAEIVDTLGGAGTIMLLPPYMHDTLDRIPIKGEALTQTLDAIVKESTDLVKIGQQLTTSMWDPMIEGKTGMLSSNVQFASITNSEWNSTLRASDMVSLTGPAYELVDAVEEVVEGREEEGGGDGDAMDTQE